MNREQHKHTVAVTQILAPDANATPCHYALPNSVSAGAPQRPDDGGEFRSSPVGPIPV